MYEKEREYLRRAVKEALTLEYYNDQISTHIYFRTAWFRVWEIDGIPVRDETDLIVSFDDRLPVDSTSKGTRNVPYNWKDWFGKLEIRVFQESKGLLKNSVFRFKLKKYDKTIFTYKDWNLGMQVSVLERTADVRELLFADGPPGKAGVLERRRGYEDQRSGKKG